MPEHASLKALYKPDSTPYLNAPWESSQHSAEDGRLLKQGWERVLGDKGKKSPGNQASCILLLLRQFVLFSNVPNSQDYYIRKCQGKAKLVQMWYLG